jgi:trk system potassium uptake protein TrkH
VAGAVPLVFGHPHLSVADSIFEAAAGITATGATVLRRLDGAAPGLLLWRALLQWMGGIGVLALGVAVLPQLNIGGMQLYRFETARLDDRLAPRALRMLAGILAVYVGLTGILALLLWVAGMDWFPSLLHAMSTISCGGFSTSDTSVGHWHNPGVDWVILVGMLLGGAPFVVHWQIVRRQWRQVGRNSQLQAYLGAIILASLAIALWLVLRQNAKPLPALRHSLFAVTSVMTGTGYATLDWSRWTGFPLALLFLLTFIGGCAGSTAGGIKVFRVQVLFANARLQFRRMLHPHAVLVPRFEGQTVSEAAAESVLGFLFVYIFAFALLAMALALVGLGFTEALGAAASALANLGPAISPDLGPLAGYGPLPDAAKWLLAGAMLFGRLELFLLLALFSRDFWQD